MRHVGTRPALFYTAVALVLGGCGPQGLPKAPVSGRVTLDGAPLDKGLLEFSPADHSTPAVLVEVRNGEYRGDCHLGKLQVRISSPRVTGQRKLYDSPDSPITDVTEEQVPPRYNIKSELTAEVKPGPNRFDFELRSR